MSRFVIAFTALVAGILLAFGQVVGAQAPSASARLLDGGAVIADHGGHVEISIPMTQAVPWKVHTLDGPPRLVIDLSELVWDRMPNVQSASILSFNAGPYRPGWSRLVLVLGEPLAVDIAEMTVDEDGQALLKLVLNPTTAGEFRDAAGADDDPSGVIAPVISKDPDKLRIALDPGHGGLDPGAEDGDLKESDIVLTFARQLKDTLLRSGRFEVVLTRDSDVFVPLYERMTLARAAGADVFLSLHADSLSEESGVASGMTVYTLTEDVTDEVAARLAERHAQNDILSGVDLSGHEDEIAMVLIELAQRNTTPRSEALASLIVTGFRSHELRVNSNPHRKGALTVLQAAEVPSVLIELGFLSTDRDREMLLSTEWIAQASDAVRDALLQWADEDVLLRDSLME